MSAPRDIRLHEVTFCSRVSKWSEAEFAADPSLPFARVEIEERPVGRRQRSDLRVYDRAGDVVLAGEVKMPGTPEGQTPFNPAVLHDAHGKADAIGARFFFSWNVSHLVLYDRSLWQRPLSERRVAEFRLPVQLGSPEEAARPDIEPLIRELLRNLYRQLARIIAGDEPDWGLKPDEHFLSALRSHLDWAARITAAWLAAQSAAHKPFRERLRAWMVAQPGWAVSDDEQTWRELLDRSARTLCYVFSNRLIFFESVRTRFPKLKPIAVPPAFSKPQEMEAFFDKRFQDAVDATGDYETIFYPHRNDWASWQIFCHEQAAQAWRSLVECLRSFNFREVRTDVLGGIFQRLIAPAERQRFGQFYTNEHLVDLINAFCLRRASDTVLDPSCGSGGFLVRAYERKHVLDPTRSHQERIREIYGSDIALFAAHLATLNLAARQINEEENYPRIARRDFFELRPGAEFWRLPGGLKHDRAPRPVPLPMLDAIVGNPPYVKQERIPAAQKERLQELMPQLWPGLNFSGRSDLHLYFWPLAARMLKPAGWFGFLVSSSWLDVEYGFALQRWLLQNFKIHAIIESQVEPWFEDARVKTCAVLLQRCDDPEARHANLTKFVRLHRPLADILGAHPDEAARQQAADRLRQRIERQKTDTADADWRIIVRSQAALWAEGLRAGQLFARQEPAVANGNDDDGEDDPEDNASVDNNGRGHAPDGDALVVEEAQSAYGGPGYGGAKWGKYLRAPDLYFRLLTRFSGKFVPLGELADVRFGVKSGCDKFFMPADVTADVLAAHPASRWKDAPLHSHCPRAAVERGELRIIQAGDRTLHPVEARFLYPEIHNFRNFDRLIVNRRNADGLVLWVDDSKKSLRGTAVLKYLRYGEEASFGSEKSGSRPPAERPTCANREPWYDLTKGTRGHMIWAKSEQYKHQIVLNPEGVAPNSRLYDVSFLGDLATEPEFMAGVVNSTLVALFKTFYGRYTGVEGAFELMVIDANLLEVPDPRHVSAKLRRRIAEAFTALAARPTEQMLTDELLACRSPEQAAKIAQSPLVLPRELTMPDRRALDLAVLELIGVADAAERETLLAEIYHETALHYRQTRLVEIQKQEQRRGSVATAADPATLAAEIWAGLDSTEKTPLKTWLEKFSGPQTSLAIPEAKRAELPEADDMVDATTVFFSATGTRDRAQRVELPHRPLAELVHLLASEVIHGIVRLPSHAKDAATLLHDARARLARLDVLARELAASRTGEEKLGGEIARLLRRWLAQGRPSESKPAASE